MTGISGARRTPASNSSAIQSYPSDRRCRHEGCGTILSIYNASAYCSVHAYERTPTRSKRPRPILVRTCANEACSTRFETDNPRRFYCGDRCRVAAFTRRKHREERRASA